MVVAGDGGGGVDVEASVEDSVDGLGLNTVYKLRQTERIDIIGVQQNGGGGKETIGGLLNGNCGGLVVRVEYKADGGLTIVGRGKIGQVGRGKPKRCVGLRVAHRRQQQCYDQYYSLHPI